MFAAAEALLRFGKDDFVTGMAQGACQPGFGCGPPPFAAADHHHGPRAEHTEQGRQPVAAEVLMDRGLHRALVHDHAKSPVLPVGQYRWAIERQRIGDNLRHQQRDARPQPVGQRARFLQSGKGRFHGGEDHFDTQARPGIGRRRTLGPADGRLGASVQRERHSFLAPTIERKAKGLKKS